MIQLSIFAIAIGIVLALYSLALIVSNDKWGYGLLIFFIGFLMFLLGVKELNSITSNPPYRFKPIPSHKTIDTLYYNVETHGDTITTITKIVKLN